VQCRDVIERLSTELLVSVESSSTERHASVRTVSAVAPLAPHQYVRGAGEEHALLAAPRVYTHA
jgi:hypothetical protein